MALTQAGWRTSAVASGGSSIYAKDVDFVSGVTRTVTHNLASINILIQLRNLSGQLIIPDVVNNFTANTVDVKVSITETYKVIITG